MSACAVALAEPRREGDGVEQLALVSVYAQTCKPVDELLRKTCARIGYNAPDSVKKSCQLPSERIEASTGRPYAAFQQTYREQLQRVGTVIAEAVQSAHEGFEREFGHMRTGSFSDTDLAALARLHARCSAVDRWLQTQARKGR